MPFNYQPLGIPFKLSAAESGTSAPDYVGNLLKGFQAGMTPKMMFDEVLKNKLANQIQSAKAKYAEQNEAANLEHTLAGTGLTKAQTGHTQAQTGMVPWQIRLLQAQEQKALRGPEPVYNNLEKAMQGYERIKQQYGQDSSEAKTAQEYINRIAQGSGGMQLSIDPETKAVTFSQGGYARGAPVQQVVEDENGNKTIVNRPSTPTSTGYQKSALANIARDYVANNLEQPYLGTGSNKQLISDRLNYDKIQDPVQKKLIADKLVKAGVAVKMAPEYGALQLTAQGVNPTVHALNKQEEAIKQGWPETINQVINNLPQELQKRVQEEHAAELQNVNKVRSQFFAQGLPIILNNQNNSKINKFKGKNSKEFREYLSKLTPQQREEVKKKYFPGVK